MLDISSATIANATPVELVIITYELIIDEVDCARGDLLNNKPDIFKRRVEKAQNYLKELIYALNYDYEIGLDLMSLYIYINKNLMFSIVNQDEKFLEEADKILNILLKAWREVDKINKEERTSVMENIEAIYSGLTYGRAGLNETVLNNTKRGLKV